MAMQDLDKVLGNGYEAKVPDLDWASMDVASYDNIPTENKVETIPQLVEQWSNRPERGTRLVGLVEAPIKKSASEVSKESIDEVVTCAKKEMMKGLRGKELAEKLASIFPPWTIKAAKDSLKSVADEQGLLGSVYVDLSVFDSCREASEFLGANRIRLADYVVGNPRKHVCSSHHDGYCKELKKTAVSEVPYGPEMYDKYTKHLRVAGILSSSECVTDKETLRGALLKTPETRHQTSIEVPAKDKSAKLKGTETLEQALEKAASDREASSSKYATSRPIMAYMQDQMLRGIIGDELKKSVGSRFSMDVVRSFSGDMRRLASLQGLVGNVYVDVGYYKNAEDAVQAISSAKTRPSYIVNTSPEAEYDGRIAAVAKATGCAPLPPDGAIDNKVAQGYIDDLRFSGRLSSEKADSYSKLLVAGRKPLAVLREAFLCTERTDKSLKSAAQMGTWYGGKSTNKVENRTAVTEAAKKALDSGVSTDRVQAKLASIVPTAEATGMVHKLLSNMTEVGASCLPHCSSETYLLAKGATIKMASKCKNCVNSTGSACLKQGAKFAGAIDYDKAFIDMTMLTAAEKDKKEDKKSDKGGDKATKYDPKDGVEPVVQKVLPKENPDVERSDMKQPYDMTDEFGSGSNKAMDKLREMDEKEPVGSKDKGKDKKKDK
jgi:hypothetical protein